MPLAEIHDKAVLVNVPAFRLTAYNAGREVLTMGIVVGAEYGGRSTPGVTIA